MKPPVDKRRKQQKARAQAALDQIHQLNQEVLKDSSESEKERLANSVAKIQNALDLLYSLKQ